jgi:phosphatidate phosphatase APP1
MAAAPFLTRSSQHLQRANVLDILAAFPDSRFFLIGDSGEQDLELRTESLVLTKLVNASSLARDRPHQITTVPIRDADSTRDPIHDLTG